MIMSTKQRIIAQVEDLLEIGQQYLNIYFIFAGNTDQR